MAPTATANADSAAPSTSPGDGNDGTSSSIAKRTIPGDYDKDIFNFAIGTAPCIVKRKRRKISQKNLKTRRERFFESMIDKLGRDDDGRIIKHYVGDMYTGGFQNALQKSKFGYVRDYGADTDGEMFLAAVAMVNDGGPRHGELFFADNARCWRRDLVWLKTALQGGSRPVVALTGAISYAKYDNKKYHLVELWTNKELQWIPSSSLECPSSVPPSRGNHDAIPTITGCAEPSASAKETLVLTDANLKTYKQMLELHEHLRVLHERTGFDCSRVELPNSNNTIVPVSFVTIKQHIADGDHAAAFAAILNNYKTYSANNSIFNLSSYRNGYSVATGTWAEKPEECNQIKDLDRLSLKQKLQYHLMKQMFNIGLTWQKLRGNMPGKVRELQTLPINNLTEISHLKLSQEVPFVLESESSRLSKNTCRGCRVRMTKKKNGFCQSCIGASLCVSCNERRSRRAGKLCERCFISKSGSAYCVLCKLGKKRRTGGLCDSCYKKVEKCAKCQLSMATLKDKEGIHCCIECYDLCKSCGESKKGNKICLGCCDEVCKKCGTARGKYGKKGELICWKCSSNKCVSCNKFVGRYGEIGNKKCAKCHEGKCVKCGLWVVRQGKKGSKVCHKCATPKTTSK